MTYPYSFKDCLQRSERITWRVEDLIGPDKPLDFARPFMPESLARTGGLAFLSPGETLALNQIRGHTYLAMFGLIEEYILPFMLDHARPWLSGDDYRARAFLEFISEEAKHIHLFRCFREAFAEGFGSPCEVIGPPEAIKAHVLSHPPLSVALLTLMIEWMTQRHYTESVAQDEGLDPQFKSLLLHHWMEEHQHAQLDAQLVSLIAEQMTHAEIEAAIDGFLALGAFFDDGLKAQVGLDLDAFTRKTGRRLSKSEREQAFEIQLQANRWTYIGSGMSHPKFLESLGRLDAERRTEVAAIALEFA
ncbi:hypothetical protein ACFODL_17785 [Phenylobacterium terrae]|uniref:DUF455 domain-containing protein n=1 Tax=Phenylobacterium terrae TaxID=2665495 RepID=A0ABW4N2C4_9CAUL